MLSRLFGECKVGDRWRLCEVSSDASEVEVFKCLLLFSISSLGREKGRLPDPAVPDPVEVGVSWRPFDGVPLRVG